MTATQDAPAPAATSWDTDAAYAHCADVTRTEARNFHYGIRLLPPPKRTAMCAVYAFARRADDIGDGDLPLPDKRASLIRLRQDLTEVHARSDDPVLVALSDASRRLPIPLAALDELIDGVLMDVDGRRYASFDELHDYCRCVAGAIGRLSLGVFGSSEPERAATLADALGIALQITNILRDVGEDLDDGRVYLPADDCRRFGWDPQRPTEDPAAFAALVRYEAEVAEAWYEYGLTLLPLLDRRSAACAAAMAGIYRRLLRRIAADPAPVLRERLSLSTKEKLRVAARSLAGAAT